MVNDNKGGKRTCGMPVGWIPEKTTFFFVVGVAEVLERCLVANLQMLARCRHLCKVRNVLCMDAL